MMRKRKIENRLLKIVNLEKRKRKKRFFIKREKEVGFWIETCVCNLETFVRVPGSGEKRKLGWRSVNEKERPRWKGRGWRSKGPPSRQFTNTSRSP